MALTKGIGRIMIPKSKRKSIYTYDKASADVLTHCSRISNTVPVSAQKLTRHWNNMAKKNPIAHVATRAIAPHRIVLDFLLTEKILRQKNRKLALVQPRISVAITL